MIDLLIIGAGAAGLAAAKEVSQAGRQVVVIEARDRIGGRVYTLHNQASQVPIELGAEFVHGKHPALMKLLDDAGTSFYDVTQHHWYFENGQFANSHEFWNKLTALMDLMSMKERDLSFQDFLGSLGDDEETQRAKAAASLYVEGFHAARIECIGVHGLIKAKEAEDEIDGEHSFRVTRGYSAVTDALHAEAVATGAVFHLKTIAKEIRWNDESVEVICKSDEGERKLTASRALITLPLGVLQASTANANDAGAVRFVPQLPADKVTAINSLEMGHVVRITLVFHERFWEKLKLPGSNQKQELSELGFIHCPETTLPTWWTLLPMRTPVLVGWTGGSNAERLLATVQHGQSDTSDDEIKERLLNESLDSLQRILGVARSTLRDLMVASHFHNWSSDPFSRGGYAYLPVHGLATQELLARPVNDVLFFAGEATSVGHIGTVHGAIESGQRAAHEILKSR